MALKDVVVLNTTSSRLEVLQSSDTLRISSSASTPFEVQNSSTSVFKVDNSAKAINVTGDVTASLDISASLVSSASFGRVEATTLVGSGAGLSNTQAEGLLSSSAQIASDISGEEILELDNHDLGLGFKKFLKKALPLTILTAIVSLIGLYFLNNTYNLDSSILKIIFIGLASLTFPHILLEYLLEKNEKQRN